MDQSSSIKIIIKRISRAILYVKTCTIILGTPSVTRTGLVVKSLFITCQKRVCRGGDRRTWAVEVDTVQHFYCELQLKPHESTLLCEVSTISIGKNFVFDRELLAVLYTYLQPFHFIIISTFHVLSENPIMYCKVQTEQVKTCHSRYIEMKLILN